MQCLVIIHFQIMIDNGMILTIFSKIVSLKASWIFRQQLEIHFYSDDLAIHRKLTQNFDINDTARRKI